MHAMKLFCYLVAGLAVSSFAMAAHAAGPAAAPAPPASAPEKKQTDKDAANKTTTTAPPAPASTTSTAPAAPASAGLKLDDYIKDLSDQLHLSDAEKAEIQGDYVNDGPALQKILNDDLLSPLQKTQQVDNLRDIRNAKIEALLTDVDRRAAFPPIEAKYRAALIDLAANGGLAAAPPAPPATASPAPAAKS
jgi:hypothetical protein